MQHLPGMPLIKHRRVTDPSDTQLDPVRGLRSAERAVRDAGRVVVESPLTVARVIDAGHHVDLVVGTASALARLAPQLILLDQRSSGTAVVLEVTPDVLDDAVGFRLHRGAIAVVVPPIPVTLDDLASSARRLAILEAVIDLENLGVLFRAATALGIDGIIVGPGCGDPWSRRAIRVSVGTALDLPWVATSDLPAAVTLLRHAGFELVALTPAGDTSLDDPRWPRFERLVVMLGAEGAGLTAGTLDLADHRVAIPMSRAVDSLNVASAAAIAFWSTRAHPHEDGAHSSAP